MDVALEIERELRVLTPGKPSLRCFIAECLARADASYGEVEAVKERLAEKLFGLHSQCGTYIRHLTREIASGRLPEPPAKERIGGLYWNQNDQAVLELGGHAEKLFLPWVIAAELAYQQNPEVLGTVEDLAAHKARIAEFEANRVRIHLHPGSEGAMLLLTALRNAHEAVTAPVRLAVFFVPSVSAGCVANTRPPRGKYVTPSSCGF